MRIHNLQTIRMDLPKQALAAVFIICVLMVSSYCSPVYNSMGPVGLLIGLALLFFIPTVKNINKALPSLLYASITVVMLVLSGRLSERGFNAPILHAAKFSIVFLTMAISAIMCGLPERWNAIILRIMIVAFLISIAVSMYCVLFVNRYAIRYNTAYGFENVLRFEQTYSLVILIPSFLTAWMSARKEQKRFILPIVFLVSGGICIAASLFTTALLLVGLGVFLTIGMKLYSKSKKVFFFLVFMMLVVGILGFIFADEVALFLYNVTARLNWILRQRVQYVIDIIFSTNYSANYSAARRSELVSYSLDSFRAHPFFGVGYSKYGYGVIGAHQEWADMLGTFGLFGTFLWFLLLIYNSVVTYKSCRTVADKHCFLLGLSLLLILGFLNPCLNFPVLFAVFCAAPNASSLFSKKELQ